MVRYRASDIQHVRGLGFRRPTILLKVYSVLTLKGQSAYCIAQKSHIGMERVVRYLIRLVKDDYVHKIAGSPTLYCRNGKNPIVEDYWEWKSLVDEVDQRFAKMDRNQFEVSQLRLNRGARHHSP